MSKGWKTTNFGKVCKIQSGAGFPNRYQGERNGKYAFYKVSDMNLFGNEIRMTSANNYISETVRLELGAKIFPTGSVIFPKVGGAIATNKKRQISKSCCVDNNVMGLIPNENCIISEYLFYLLHDIDIYEFSNKSNPPSIRQATVIDWPIKLPPLAEQKRIVTILDEVFARIDRAAANTEKNLANARELFESRRNALLSQSGDGWVNVALGDVCDFQGGSQPPKSQFVNEPRDGYIRMLQIRDFKSDAKAVYIPITGRNNLCTEQDIMIGRYGASVGQIHRGKAGAYNVALIKTIPDRSKLDRNFLYYFLSSSLFQVPLATVADRSAQAGFSKADIVPFQIPLPPLSEQLVFVEKLDQIGGRVIDLESVFKIKHASFLTLKQSLLQKAFVGQLTAAPDRVLTEAGA